MVKRSVNSPWGNVYKEGLPSTAVDDKTLVDQEVRPVINTGSINVETGKWEGVTLSDENFRIDPPHVNVANGAAVVVPQLAEHQYIDMTGFKTLQIAIKPTTTGNVALYAVMGPSSNSYANLNPVNAGSILKGAYLDVEPADLDHLFQDTAESLTANVWNIFMIQDVLANQKSLNFTITNNSGSISTIDFAYLRVV